jgi:hypothetical protein
VTQVVHPIRICGSDPDLQCCFVNERGDRCEAESRFWIGRTFLSCSYGCGDHAEDLRGDERPQGAG